ncbi:hypothetical protein HDV63DRAFT_77937 [Trichoderma sp. SZMC 28014]
MAIALPPIGHNRPPPKPAGHSFLCSAHLAVGRAEWVARRPKALQVLLVAAAADHSRCSIRRPSWPKQACSPQDAKCPRLQSLRLSPSAPSSLIHQRPRSRGPLTTTSRWCIAPCKLDLVSPLHTSLPRPVFAQVANRFPAGEILSTPNVPLLIATSQVPSGLL